MVISAVSARSIRYAWSPSAAACPIFPAASGSPISLSRRSSAGQSSSSHSPGPAATLAASAVSAEFAHNLRSQMSRYPSGYTPSG